MTEKKAAPLPMIFLLDDDADFCELFKFQFQKQGFKVEYALRCQDAWDYLTREFPHCFLVDIRLGSGEDGLTFIRKIRSFRDDDSEVQQKVRQIPILVITSAGTYMKSLFEAENIQGYIEKPFDVEKLAEKILSLKPLA